MNHKTHIIQQLQQAKTLGLIVHIQYQCRNQSPGKTWIWKPKDHRTIQAIAVQFSAKVPRDRIGRLMYHINTQHREVAEATMQLRTLTVEFN